MNAMFSPSTVTFYAENMIKDGSYGDSLPDDLIVPTTEELTTYWKQMPPINKQLGVINGRPAWIDVSLPPMLTSEQLAAIARQYRDAFIVATDPIMVSDYSIDDTPLTEVQRTELTAIRTAYRVWPTQDDWPLIELPELPQWLLVEAVNQGYFVPTWPPEM
ncbi:TPA: phage tail protein [Yersinia enterocolitica]|uniref:phage tail protein n=1 Tax=Yersinia enterocolitica TaxID=630 RepID=UPI00296CA079|nr:phage tail protein [Yersinia enterocolitica]HEG0622244.1 phage tail protein [Yersinia enterocolitica]